MSRTLGTSTGSGDSGGCGQEGFVDVEGGEGEDEVVVEEEGGDAALDGQPRLLVVQGPEATRTYAYRVNDPASALLTDTESNQRPAAVEPPVGNGDALAAGGKRGPAAAEAQSTKRAKDSLGSLAELKGLLGSAAFTMDTPGGSLWLLFHELVARQPPSLAFAVFVDAELGWRLFLEKKPVPARLLGVPNPLRTAADLNELLAWVQERKGELKTVLLWPFFPLRHWKNSRFCR